MKTLTVKDILEPIGGVLVRGREGDKIRHAVKHAEELKSRTLLFDWDGKSHLLREAWAAYPHTVLVTASAGYFRELKCGWSIIEVERVEDAFWRFVSYYRGLWELPVIGVTGTCGKTTVKEMIAHVLSGFINIRATYKSKNALERNFSYLMSIDEKTEAGVFEMGVACPDDLLHSSRFFRPTIGVITTIGTDHLQHCGTQENYIKEKAKLLDGMGNRGTLVLNADDENIKKIDTSRFEGEIVSFGLEEEADYRALGIRYSSGGMKFTLSAGGKTYPAYIPGYGQHNVYNALAALAACRAAGMPLSGSVRRLASFRHVESHLQIRPGLRGSTVIDDTWSSNPTSAEAALKVLQQMAKGRKTVAILGKMELLGDHSRKEHALLGEKCARYGVDVLITIDGTADRIGMRAIEAGMHPRRVFFCRTAGEVYEVLRRIAGRDTMVLLKTSMLDRKTAEMKKRLISGRSGR